MGIVLVAAIFYFCIKHLLNYESPGKTTLIYAFASLALVLVENIFTAGSSLTFLLVSMLFVYDLITGYILFWLLNRYIDNLAIFYLIIVLAIVYSIVTRFYGFFSALP